ncbi:MAG: hypothetical protein ACREOG_14095, partial [Gemmatimonadaceae bacterium]
ALMVDQQHDSVAGVDHPLIELSCAHECSPYGWVASMVRHLPPNVRRITCKAAPNNHAVTITVVAAFSGACAC